MVVAARFLAMMLTLKANGASGMLTVVVWDTTLMKMDTVDNCTNCSHSLVESESDIGLSMASNGHWEPNETGIPIGS